MNATSWFARNLSIAGFSESCAAFTTAKELIDNAVDASRSSDYKKLQIALTVEKRTDTSEIAIITCNDWGKGICASSVDAIAGLFDSTKSSECAGGKFGIGLKLIALNSIKQTGHKLRITTRDVSVELSIVGDRVDISDLKAHDPIEPTADASDNPASPPSLPSTPVTSVTAFSLCPERDLLINRLCSYLKELKITLGEDWLLSLAYRYRDACSSSSESRTLSEEFFSFEEPTNRDIVSVQDFSAGLKASLELQRKEKRDVVSEITEIFEKKRLNGKSVNGNEKTVNPPPTDPSTNSTDMRDLINEAKRVYRKYDSDTESDLEDTGPKEDPVEYAFVTMIRSINQAPLVYKGGDCAILSSIVSAFNQAEPHIGIQKSFPAIPSVLYDPIGCDMKVVPPLESFWDRIVIRLDACIKGDECEYTSLIKSGVASKNGSLSAAVHRLIARLLKAAKRKWRKEFVSRADAEFVKMEKLYIPCIAQSYANMAARTDDLETREAFERVCGGANLSNQDFKNHVRDYIKNYLLDKFIYSQKHK